ncbi:MAG: class I SAM-dependent methyltransferase [Candidatus Promineifilaceae bacterium]|nr:class I SAM-dependent methyltransferase [Candidatus Promineifilaceae bacterium]
MNLTSIPCNLCGAQDSERLYEKGGLPIARCRRCSLIYANPRLTQEEIWQRYSPTYFWDEYMPAHRAAGGEYVEAVHRQRATPLLNLIEPYRQLNTLLEIGCAAGFFLKVAAAERWDVIGIEIMAPAVTYARDTLGLDVRAGVVEEANLPPASFDAIVMIETVEHLLDPAATLRTVHQLLRPGGVFLVAVPNYNSLMRSLLGSSWSVLSPAEHLYYFTEHTLERMLAEVGFRSSTFIWHTPGQGHLETLNPHNSHQPQSWRSRVVRWTVGTFGALLQPLVIRSKRTDRLLALAVK